MNKFRRVISIVVLCMATCTIFAQDVVSLVVSGEGKDKNEATQNALRSAIEQTLGTFVSANTTILNDQLVADEVVSLSSGNIKKYNYITENRLPNGNSYVTLSVEVALKKLVSYAKSKGSECEFAGAAFGANIKQYKFYLESSRKVLNNLRLQCVEMAPFLYDYELEVGEPQIDGTVEFTVKVLANENTNTFGDLIINTLEAIEFDSIYAKQLESMGVETVAVSFHARGGFLKKYELWDSLRRCYYNDWWRKKTLYFERKLGTNKYFPEELYSPIHPWGYIKDNGTPIEITIGDHSIETSSVYVHKDSNSFLRIVSRLQVLSYGNFIIRDNLGNEYYVTDDYVTDDSGISDHYYYSPDALIRNIVFGYGYGGKYECDYQKNRTCYSFDYESDVGNHRYSVWKKKAFYEYEYKGRAYSHAIINTDYTKGEQCFEVHLKVKIPLDTLMNISKFTVERKETKF